MPTFVISRNADAEPVKRRSILPWLLPLIGIAMIGAIVAYLNGLIAIPKFGTEIVKAHDYAPKLDDMKEVLEIKIHTPQNTSAPKQDADPQPPAVFAKRYAGDVSFYRTMENSFEQPLTNCVPGQRSAPKSKGRCCTFPTAATRS